MTAYNLCWLFFLHFVADFLLQSREMGKNKSTQFSVLLNHLSIQFWTILVGMAFVAPTSHAIWLSFANAVIHGIIDWNIWKLYKLSAHFRIEKQLDVEVKVNGPDAGAIRKELYNKKVKGWQYWEDHWFYSTIGFDQMLHGFTLIMMAKYFL